jgi:hypothetical protein
LERRKLESENQSVVKDVKVNQRGENPERGSQRQCQKHFKLIAKLKDVITQRLQLSLKIF